MLMMADAVAILTFFKLYITIYCCPVKRLSITMWCLGVWPDSNVSPNFVNVRPNSPSLFRNSLIFNMRYVMGRKVMKSRIYQNSFIGQQ